MIYILKYIINYDFYTDLEHNNYIQNTLLFVQKSNQWECYDFLNEKFISKGHIDNKLITFQHGQYLL